MLTESDVIALSRRGEGPTLEFKVSTPFPENLARLISGFANTDGGVLLVGIREPATVAGTDPARFKNFVAKAAAMLHGKVELSSYVVQVEGKTVGAVEVKRAQVPVSAPQGYFQRVAEQEQLLEAKQLVSRMAAAPSPAEAIASLSETISAQSKEVAKLRESFENANSWKRKLFYAFLGALATAIVKLVLAGVGF